MLCGSPVFQYDHIIEYNEVKEHTAENLVLLCPNHHDSKTTGKLSVENVIEGKKNPFNKNNKLTTANKLERAKNVDVIIGTNTTIPVFELWGHNSFHCLWVNETSMFRIENNAGWLSFSVRITNETGELLLLIDRGEMYVSTENWDYTYEGNTLVVRNGLRSIILEMTLTNDSVHLHRANLRLKNGDGFAIKDGYLNSYIDNNLVSQDFGSSVIAAVYGGWAIINTRITDPVNYVNGFGFTTSR